MGHLLSFGICQVFTGNMFIYFLRWKRGRNGISGYRKQKICVCNSQACNLSYVLVVPMLGGQPTA